MANGLTTALITCGGSTAKAVPIVAGALWKFNQIYQES